MNDATIAFLFRHIMHRIRILAHLTTYLRRISVHDTIPQGISRYPLVVVFTLALERSVTALGGYLLRYHSNQKGLVNRIEIDISEHYCEGPHEFIV